MTEKFKQTQVDGQGIDVGAVINQTLDREQEAIAPENRPESSPQIGHGFRDKEALFRGIQKGREQAWKSPRKIVKALLLILFAVAASGIGYAVGKHPWREKSGEVLINAEELAGKKIIISNENGVSQARLSKREGVVCFELCDAAGKTRASISLAKDNEAKFCLYDKDQKKVNEWKWPTDDNPEGKSPDKPIGASPVTENVDTPKNIPAPKYIGSKTSNKYHYPDCAWAKEILPERVLNFHSVKEAQEKGYIRCRACRPPRSDPPDESQRAESNPLPETFGKMPLASEGKD